MQFFDPNNPNEKKKMIAAGALGLVAILVLGYVFFGGSSSKQVANHNRPSPTPKTIMTQEVGQPQGDDNSNLTEVIYNPATPPWSESNRNIFAYYVPPTPTPKPPPIPPTPSPTPTPPMTAQSLSPSVVYARTPGDFTLQVSGDKFTPAVKIVFDGRELPTRFVSTQQLFTTVPATYITNPGVRKVIVRTSDNRLYSNEITLNVTPAPEPNYTYVGLIGKPRYNDTAVLQDKSTKELINVQRGDAVGGRFRVVSISEKEVMLIEATLKIRYTISFSKEQSGNAPFRPASRSVDDEP